MLNVKTNTEVEESGDSLGGFKVWDTNAYEAVVKALYIGSFKSGAQYAGIHLLIDGQEYRERVTFTNKDNENFYKDKKTGKPKEMPGFQIVNELILLTTGVGLLDGQEMEEKVLKLYDPEVKAETNQSVPCVINAMNKPIIVGITKNKVFKQAKNAQTGAYENTAETREENQINKFFHSETQGTVTEYKKDLKLGSFFEEWTSQNGPNTVIDRTKGQTPTAAGGAPGRPGQTGGETKSLFGNK